MRCQKEQCTAFLNYIFILFSNNQTFVCLILSISLRKKFLNHANIRDALDDDDISINLYWTLENGTATIGVHVKNHDSGYFSLGMSANGGMMGADIWTFTKNQDSGDFELVDMFVEDWVQPIPDTDQNLKLMSAYQAGGTTAFMFQRDMKTCDGGAQRYAKTHGQQDFDIVTNDVTNLIYAWGNDHEFRYHRETRRGYVTNFWWGEVGESSISSLLPEEEGRPTPGGDGDDDGNQTTWDDAQVVRFVNDPYTISHERSTILVHTHFNPPSGSWVITNIQQISDGAVSRYHHHMLFYGCTEEVDNHTNALEERGEGVCNEILAVSNGFGLAIGDGSEVRSFRVEVHYDGLHPLTDDLVDPGAGYEVRSVFR